MWHSIHVAGMGNIHCDVTSNANIRSLSHQYLNQGEKEMKQKNPTHTWILQSEKMT